MGNIVAPEQLGLLLKVVPAQPDPKLKPKSKPSGTGWSRSGLCSSSMLGRCLSTISYSPAGDIIALEQQALLMKVVPETDRRRVELQWAMLPDVVPGLLTSIHLLS